MSAAADSAKPNSKAILQRLSLLFPVPTLANAYVLRAPMFRKRLVLQALHVFDAAMFLVRQGFHALIFFMCVFHAPMFFMCQCFVDA
jgi:hypothetical protein